MWPLKSVLSLRCNNVVRITFSSHTLNYGKKKSALNIWLKVRLKRNICHSINTRTANKLFCIWVTQLCENMSCARSIFGRQRPQLISIVIEVKWIIQAHTHTQRTKRFQHAAIYSRHELHTGIRSELWNGRNTWSSWIWWKLQSILDSHTYLSAAKSYVVSLTGLFNLNRETRKQRI